MHVVFTLLLVLVIPSWREAYLRTQTTPFDVGYYTGIALGGYEKAVWTAFHPLWPLALRAINAIFSPSHLGLAGALTSAVLFACAGAVFARAVRPLFAPRTAAFVVACFVLQPLAVFHFIAYTESLAALLVAVWMVCVVRFASSEARTATSPVPKTPGGRSLAVGYAGGVFVTAALLSLCRPLLLPLVSGCLAHVCYVALLALVRHFNAAKTATTLPFRWLCASALTVLGAVAGYAIFALHTLAVHGDAFASFTAQKAWGKVFKPHWELLFSPKAVSGSDNVLILDATAFYAPIVLAIALIVACVRGTHQTGPNREAPFYFEAIALGWAVALCAAQFMSLPIFQSHARYVFASPLWWVAVAAACQRGLTRVSPQRRTVVAVVFLAVCLGVQLYWWTRFVRGGWIG